MHDTYDVIIVGAGMVGLTLAHALATHTSLRIAVLDAKTLSTHPEHLSSTVLARERKPFLRVSAVTLASMRIFAALNVWEMIQDFGVSPLTQIEVRDAMNPQCLRFDSTEIGEKVLGYIVENNVIESALMLQLKKHSTVELIAPINLQSLYSFEEGLVLQTAEKNHLRGKLLVGADGPLSWLREQSGILVTKHDYAQGAIIATVATELPHDTIARQVFLDTGPLAFLPLRQPHLSSIVWTLPLDAAKKQNAWDVQDFLLALSEAFAYRLGKVTALIGERAVHPLYRQHAHTYVKPHLALVGDAAHTVHPLAGQGANLGFMDAAYLAEVIISALSKGRDFSAFSTLRPYERARKSDNFIMLSTIDALKILFSNQMQPLARLRGISLGLTNQMPFIKNFFSCYAVGNRANLPKFARARL